MYNLRYPYFLLLQGPYFLPLFYSSEFNIFYIFPQVTIFLTTVTKPDMCLKITEKVSFNIASEASSVHILHTVTKVDFSSKNAQNLLTRFSKFLGPKLSSHHCPSYSMKKLQGLFHKKIHNFNFSETVSLLP